MPRQMVTIEVNVKGTKVSTKTAFWTRGLDEDSQADELVVLADAIEQGLITGEKIFSLLNYAEDLKARAAARPSLTVSDEALNELASQWARLEPEQFELVRQQGFGEQTKALRRLYVELHALNDSKKPSVGQLAGLLQTHIDHE